MLPSLRLAIYVAIGTLFWIVAYFLPEFLTAAILYDVILLFVAVCDLVLSPKPAQFELERAIDEKMNLGAPNTVRLIAHFKAPREWRPVNLLVRDEPPADWPVQTTATALTLAAPLELPRVPRIEIEATPHSPGRRPAENTYSVLPTRRGDFEFGALSARYKTMLGLWHRQFRRPATQAVRVYPDTSEVRRYELSLRQGRLQDIGLHLLRLRGRGTEYESLRDYTTDDEYKDINWKATARRGKLISTNFEIERDQTIIIAIDCGRMMTAMAVAREAKDAAKSPVAMRDFATAPVAAGATPEKNSIVSTFAASEVVARESEPLAVALPAKPEVALSKLDCAINATVLLAHVAAGMGDAVGLLLFTDTVTTFVPPRKGRTQTGTIIEALYAAQPQLVEPDYTGAYQYLMARKIRRSLVVTFTDLIDPYASRELLTASGALRRHHNALCVTINNRDVMDMAAVAPQTAEELYEKAMAQRMLSQRAGALEKLRQHGVGILDVEASQLTIATVNRYLDLKARAAL